MAKLTVPFRIARMIREGRTIEQIHAETGRPLPMIRMIAAQVARDDMRRAQEARDARS
ncbi:hypothetical protein [Bifidobacterium simiarum]|uniref:hypothetical protein n=1 Tax=Bifidobacterium simiarum TaxID=2045441 RepID=UPI001BDC732B|nr:hypothetical protein [Bifidobacterium simiarum]MBT1166797.1 hypothetical protein [Bifidobacterium simiarum]